MPSCSDLVSSCPPSLSDQLRRRTDQRRSKIVRVNYNTQFAQTAPELAEFRDTTIQIDGMDDDTLSEVFRRTVGFTNYGSYAPLIARFFENPCKVNAVADLLSPGLPDYIITSSSTSGGLAKSFPKYNVAQKIASSDRGPLTISDPPQSRTSAHIWYFWCDPMNLEDDNNCLVKTIYLTAGSTTALRGYWDLDPAKDKERMGTFLFDHAIPYAVGFIKNWRSSLIIHALFALRSRPLKTVTMGFITTFVDMMRHLDTEFDKVVDCIANGTIPDLDGLTDVRRYLEANVFPDPERAAELRSLGRPFSRPGWCAHAWPNMKSVAGIAGGSFAVRWLLGPNMEIRDTIYVSTEAMVGYPYDVLEVNRYKVAHVAIIEFLDISKSDSISDIAQLWEVEQGKRYEVVATTTDGLWRYRLGDVIEIAGFDPTDGVPVIQVVGRRSVALRFNWFTVSEEELRAAISFMAKTIPVQVIGWTATVDDRQAPDTIGFFVELAGDQGADLARAADYVLEELSRSIEKISTVIKFEWFRKPTVRVLRPGTFGDFQQLRLDEGSNNAGQIKVPAVLPKAEYVIWFSDRVVQEL